MAEAMITWFAGVDWGSEKHHACLLDGEGAIVGERECFHSAARLADLGDWLLSIAGSATCVGVSIEVPHGRPIVDALMDRGFLVYAINPKQLDRLGDRFSVARAKDDRRDAYVSADGLRTDRHLFRCLQVPDARFVELRTWSRLAEELQEERVRLSNRLYHQLWRYCPQMLPMIWPLRGFSSFGTGHQPQPTRTVCVSRALSGYSGNIASVWMLRRSSHVTTTGHQSGGWGIGGKYVGQRDVAILKSLPGIGRINLATLLAEASGPLSQRD